MTLHLMPALQTSAPPRPSQRETNADRLSFEHLRRRAAAQKSFPLQIRDTTRRTAETLTAAPAIRDRCARSCAQARTTGAAKTQPPLADRSHSPRRPRRDQSAGSSSTARACSENARPTWSRTSWLASRATGQDNCERQDCEQTAAAWRRRPPAPPGPTGGRAAARPMANESRIDADIDAPSGAGAGPAMPRRLHRDRALQPGAARASAAAEKRAAHGRATARQARRSTPAGSCCRVAQASSGLRESNQAEATAGSTAARRMKAAAWKPGEAAPRLAQHRQGQNLASRGTLDVFLQAGQPPARPSV